MTSKAECRSTVTQQENDSLWAAAEEEVHTLSPLTFDFSHEQDVLDAATAARALTEALPSRVRDDATSFAEDKGEQDFLVINGIAPPKEMLQTLPRDRRLPNSAAVNVTKLVAITMASLVGSPLCYSKDHPKGPESFIGMVAPDPKEVKRSLAGYSDLSWHCEIPGPGRPDFQTLFCIRGQQGVSTKIVTPSRLLPHIDESDLALLQEARFFTTLGFGGSSTNTPLAVIEEASAGFRLNFDYEFMRPLDKDDVAAHEVLGRLAMLLSSPDVYTQYELSSGDSLCFRNGLALHGRDGFKPDFTETRTLFRIFSGDAQHFPNAPLADLMPVA